MSNNECISYQPHPYEYLLPSPIIIDSFCMSYDKTELFIVSLIRLIIYVIIYFVVDENIDLQKYRILKYILLVFIAINIVYLGLVVSKNTLFSAGSTQSIFGYQYG